MDIYRDETDFTDIRNIHKVLDLHRVVDMFDSRPGFQRIVRLGLIAGMDYDDEQDVTDEDDYGTDNSAHGYDHFHEYPRLSDKSSARGLNHTRPSSSAHQLPLHYSASSREPPHPVTVQAKESDSERRARLLEEEGKLKIKAEKKRLKKQKRKERKQLEKLENEKQNPIRNEEGNDDAQQSQSKGSKPVNDDSKNDTIPSVKQSASARDTDSSDSSENESSDEETDTKNDCGESEELDMTSTFVSKAALIARRKLEQKSQSERGEKKKSPVKEKPKTVPNKPSEDPHPEKKDSAASGTPTLQDNVRISTDLAVIGNRIASTGDFKLAVKYFTDAIKYNPTEFKLFGNRSFCFEKMQEYEKALTDAELSLSMCPGWVKGMFRRGRALAGLKRYDEAAQAFREVLKLDRSCAEAAQELMRVQITQIMEYGFSREQSSNALIIHGTVKKAIEVLAKLNNQPGSIQNGTPQPAQMANFTGVSPVLSANTIPAAAPYPPQSHDVPKPVLKNKPLEHTSNVQPKPFANQAMKTNNKDIDPPQELFPVWVGNLVNPVTESVITEVFNKVGVVYSVKLLISKRCAFVNFTKQEFCDEAIYSLNGSELNGMKIAVRYPDRIPRGMGISRSALKADDVEEEDYGQDDYGPWRPRHYRPLPPWYQKY